MESFINDMAQHTRIAASGAGTLLGYAYKAPSDAQGGVEIARHWCSLRAGRGDVEAWMEANDCRSGHNACAMQRIDNSCIEYHYFMKRARLYWSRRTLTLQLEGQ